MKTILMTLESGLNVGDRADTDENSGVQSVC
jgi:hypothetical protein